MGMNQKELDESSATYLVRKINGFNAAKNAEIRFRTYLFRELCFYAGNGGNFKNGVKREDVFPVPGERKALEQLKQREIEEIKQGREWMKSWPTPKGIA